MICVLEKVINISLLENILNFFWQIFFWSISEKCVELALAEEAFLGADVLDDGHWIYRSPEQCFERSVTFDESRHKSRCKRIAATSSFKRWLRIRINRHVVCVVAVEHVCTFWSICDED